MIYGTIIKYCIVVDIQEAPPGTAPLEICLGGGSGASNLLAGNHDPRLHITIIYSIAVDIQEAPPGAAPLEICLGGGGSGASNFLAGDHNPRLFIKYIVNLLAI